MKKHILDGLTLDNYRSVNLVRVNDGGELVTGQAFKDGIQGKKYSLETEKSIVGKNERAYYRYWEKQEDGEWDSLNGATQLYRILDLSDSTALIKDIETSEAIFSTNDGLIAFVKSDSKQSFCIDLLEITDSSDAIEEIESDISELKTFQMENPKSQNGDYNPLGVHEIICKVDIQEEAGGQKNFFLIPETKEIFSKKVGEKVYSFIERGDDFPSIMNEYGYFRNIEEDDEGFEISKKEFFLLPKENFKIKVYRAFDDYLSKTTTKEEEHFAVEEIGGATSLLSSGGVFKIPGINFSSIREINGFKRRRFKIKLLDEITTSKYVVRIW